MNKIPRYISDQNAISLLFESGTYAVPSGTGQWLGQVQENEFDENFNYQPIRFTNTTSRNVQTHVDGQTEYNGTFTFFPQDFRIFGFALGSHVDGGSPSPYGHRYREINSGDGYYWTSGTFRPFPSFTIEDVHSIGTTGSSAIRYMKGCMIDSLTMSWDQGGIIECEAEYIGQTIDYASGTVGAGSSATTGSTTRYDTSYRPFIWSDVRVHIPSGTVIDEVTAGEISVANNVERRFYSNGSRITAVPVPLNRDYEVSLTLDQTAENFKSFYTGNLASGTTFNMMIEVNANTGTLGSRYGFFIYSGCKMMDIESPTPQEGINETTLTIQPLNLAVNEQNLYQYTGPGSIVEGFTGDP